MTHRTWDAFHRRGDVLRAVVDHADAHRDGLVPTHLPGVAETFRDETDLVAALQLRWHTRLAGRIERALVDQPTDLETAVLSAWSATAADLPGIRMILDRELAEPGSEETASALRRAQDKDHALLAVMAGRAGLDDAAAPRVGRELEQRARAAYDPTAVPRHRAEPSGSASLLGRLKAVLAA